jgi:hypothetical protein
MTGKLVTEDGNPVNSATCLEVLLDLLRRCQIVDLK